MLCKALEIRDKAMFIPALAVVMTSANAEQHYLLRRCGYSGHAVMLTRMSGEGKATADPYFWGDRTWQVAHLYITEKWLDLKDGDVVDVEYILGETLVKKVSEKFTSSY